MSPITGPCLKPVPKKTVKQRYLGQGGGKLQLQYETSCLPTNIVDQAVCERIETKGNQRHKVYR